MTVIFIAILAAGLTEFLNYCIGKPGSKEFSPYEIFSFYTIWLSKRRLKQSRPKDWAYYQNQYSQIKSPDEIHKKDFNKIIYEAAEPLFTWERVFGMCAVCSGFWISLFTGLYFTKDIVELITIVLLSHVTIRLLNKVI